jgi:hypothetical protein
MKANTLGRRGLLRGLAGAALLAPFSGLFSSVRADAPRGKAKRILFFYFPDGVPNPGGSEGRFFPGGNDTSFTLSQNLAPLARYQRDCIFVRGLSMGPTDAGSHPGGAKKLLTAVDGGNGESIDRWLARNMGGGAPVSHLYLGAMAAQNNASGDKFVSYVGPGLTVAPEDDPRAAFARLFGGATPNPSGGGSGVEPDDTSVLDGAFADLEELRKHTDGVDKTKLDLHLEALRDVEKRVKGLGAVQGTCASPRVDTTGIDSSKLYDAATFPQILRAQSDLMVQAMACGITNVGVLQCSQHTSELIMSRFAGSPLYKPNYDMRSHQASHYGQTSDSKYADYVAQRTWFVAQAAYVLDQLAARPEGTGTMLDNSIVVLCSEVSDGNTHSHDDMPFVVCGRGGGALRTGRIVDAGGRRHGELLVSLAQAMGANLGSFGSGGGPLPGILV